MNIAKSVLGTMSTSSVIKANCRKVMCIGRNYAYVPSILSLLSGVSHLTDTACTATMSPNSTTNGPRNPSSS